MPAGISRTRIVSASRWAWVTVWLATIFAPANAATYSEAAVKAAFLYRFTGYVDWPVAIEPGAKFTIAVLDDDGVAADLETLISTLPIKKAPSQVRKIRNIKDVDNAQVLYIGHGYKGNLRKSLANIVPWSVLIVTNQAGALDDGSTINFLQSDNKIRFEVSMITAQRSGLKIDPELLSVAANVVDDRRRQIDCSKAVADSDVHCNGAP